MSFLSNKCTTVTKTSFIGIKTQLETEKLPNILACAFNNDTDQEDSNNTSISINSEENQFYQI